MSSNFTGGISRSKKELITLSMNLRFLLAKFGLNYPPSCLVLQSLRKIFGLFCKLNCGGAD